MADENAGSIREAWERLEGVKLDADVRAGKPPTRSPWTAKIAWCMGARALLEVLKQTDPDRILPALWRAERELEAIGRDATGDMIEDMGVAKVVEILAGRSPGDGDSLDVRPPGRGPR